MTSTASLDIPLDVEGIKAMLAKMTPAEMNDMAAKADKRFFGWAPQPGPQTRAYFSEADELLYGGAAGGGKSDLLLGLATTAHQRSLIFRNQSTDLVSLFERLMEIEPNPRKKDLTVKSMITSTGRRIETGHLELPGSERNHMGRPKDLIGFDEAALLSEMKVKFVMQWLRSTDPKQRKRVVLATNPPMPEIKDGKMTDVAVGDWLIRWFAPWLDPTYPHPAEQGELRWCFMIAEGDRITTVWVDGPGAYDPITHAKVEATEADIDAGRVTVARSRTFIRSLVKDNMFLRGTGYAEQLSATPEPMRSMLLLGDFTIKGEDHPKQVIPTAWVLAAQERWEDAVRDPDRINDRMLVLSGDIAQGGAAMTVLAPLMTGDFYEELIVAPGKDTPRGEDVEMMILMNREDNALIVLDGTGGWAGGATSLLKRSHDIDVELFVASKTDGSWDSKGLWRFANNRTKMWWEFREALDPKSVYKIALPPSIRLRAQLTTPHFIVKGKELYIESKDEVAKRLNGSSTDEADAVLQGWQYRDQAILNIINPTVDIVDRINGRGRYDPSRGNDAVEMYDPRG